MTDYSVEIHEGFLLLQRRARAIRRGVPFILNDQESILLNLIASQSRIVGSSIARALGLHQSAVSRFLGALKSRGHLTGEVGNTLAFTDDGLRLVEELDRYQGRINDNLAQYLEEHEREALGRLLDELADGLGAPALKTRNKESLMVSARRRLTIRLGLLAPAYFNTRHSIAEYQVLFELYRRKDTLTVTALSKLLPFDVSKLSRSVQRFVDAALVERRKDGDDRRAATLCLTAGGKRYFEELHSRTSAPFGKALRRLAPDEKELLCDLLRKIVTPPSAGIKFDISARPNKSQRLAARRFLIEAIAEAKHVIDIPETLLAAESSVFLAHRDGLVVGVVEITSVRGRPRIEWLASKDGAESQAAISGLVSAILAKQNGKQLDVRSGAVVVPSYVTVPDFSEMKDRINGKSPESRRRR